MQALAEETAFGGTRRARWAVALPLIALMAFAATAPLLFLGSPDGHDFAYHMDAWTDAAQQLHTGVWFPQWADQANYGFGDARFTFYPPLLRTLGAALLFLVPVDAAPGAFIFIMLVTAGACMFALARQWLSPPHALVAAMFYAVNPYILLCVYQRAAFAELITNALCPLLMLCAVQLTAGNRAIVPLAMVFAACWISDLPAAVVMTYALTLMVLVLAVLHRSRTVLLRGLAAMSLGFALVAYYVLPAAYEQRWVNIAGAITPDFRPENWEYTWHYDAEADWYYAILSAIVYGEVIAAGLGAALMWIWRGSCHVARWVLTTVAAASIFMTLPVSRFVWTRLPKLEFVQFPWRWLLVLSACMTLLLAAALARRRVRWLALVLMMAAFCGGIGSGWSASWNRQAVSYYREALQTGGGYAGDAMFMPPKVRPEDIATVRAMPRVRVEDPEARVSNLRWDPEHKTLTVDSPQPTTVILHLLNYPAWRATVNGRVVAIAADKLARVAIPVPAGNSRVEIKFTVTPDRILGLVISLVALPVLAGIWRAADGPDPFLESRTKP